MDKTLNVGLVGVGAIGRTHIDRINRKLSGAKVIACADVNAEFCRSVAEKYGLKAYESGEEMIAAPDVEAVIVTTLDPFHAQYVLAAIAAGKPAFCEKPLAPEASVCRKIVDAEMASGKHLVQVGFMRRYDAGYMQLKEVIQSGKYGAPLLLHCAHRNPTVPDSYDTPMEVENSMIHEIDVLRWLLGEDYATAEVRFGKKCRRARANLQDPQVMILTTKSGVRIDVEAFVTTGHCYQIKCEVVCEDGILNLPESPTINVCAGANVGHALTRTGLPASPTPTIRNFNSGLTRRKKAAWTAPPRGTATPDRLRRRRPRLAIHRPSFPLSTTPCRTFTSPDRYSGHDAPRRVFNPPGLFFVTAPPRPRFRGK